MSMLPSNHATLLNQLKADIRQSRQRAAMTANLELLQLLANWKSNP
ncbi:hypothetical protein QE357_000376 [Siphonobacter sp. BAB-5404]|nr:hypothetical protein [Siphonobacter sp. SORGH_AS_0500]